MNDTKYCVTFPECLKPGDLIYVGVNLYKVLDYTQCVGAGVFPFGEYGRIDCKKFNFYKKIFDATILQLEVYKRQPLIKVIQ